LIGLKSAEEHHQDGHLLLPCMLASSD
jgi:hypothetical protein